MPNNLHIFGVNVEVCSQTLAVFLLYRIYVGSEEGGGGGEGGDNVRQILD